jgi:hypothetical protein
MATGGGQGKAAGYYQYPASYAAGAAAADEERRWWPWLVPTVLVACIAVFAAEMFVNDCPRHGSALGGGAGCVAAGLLRRFSFQPLRENPLFGPSSATYASSLLANCDFRSCFRRVVGSGAKLGVSGRVCDGSSVMILSQRSRFGCGFQVQSLVKVVFKKKKVKIGAYSFTSCHFLGRFQLRSFGNGGHCAMVTIYRYL